MEKKILLIDDSAILRRIATNVLSTRSGGGEVLTATRATEGFARACASGVGLILVDFQVAGQPDAPFCRRLLEEPRTKDIPVILLLGRGITPVAEAAMPSNIVGTLVKPFTPEQLVSAVQAVFEGSTRPRQAAHRVQEPAITPFVAAATELTDDRAVTVAATTGSKPLALGEKSARPRAVFRATNRPLARRTETERPRLFAPARLRTALTEAAARLEPGVFRVRAGRGAPTEVYVEDGQIVVVSTRDANRYSQDSADIVSAKVSTTILDEAVAEQAKSGVPFFLALGSRGLLSKTTAITLLHRFGQQHFARLWTVPPEMLSCEFHAMEALPGFALRLEPRRECVDDWLLGTLRHLQPVDVAAFAKREGFAGSAVFRKGGADAFEALRLSEQEREFGKQIEGHRDLLAVAQALGITAEAAFILLFRFRCLEIMDYRPPASAFVVTPRTSVRRVLPLQR